MTGVPLLAIPFDFGQLGHLQTIAWHRHLVCGAGGHLACQSVIISSRRDARSPHRLAAASPSVADWKAVPRFARLRGMLSLFMEKVIIVGSGCAGLTAAIYAARANLSPLVLEGRQPGGQLSTTTLVENYPGFPDGIDGPELILYMHRQAEKFGARFSYAEVSDFDGNNKHVRIKADEKGERRAVSLRNVKTGEERDLAVACVFMAIRHDPNTRAYRGKLDMDTDGYLVTKNLVESKYPGVFVAGDVADRIYKQAVTAAGSGCAAAMDAEKYLSELES